MMKKFAMVLSLFGLIACTSAQKKEFSKEALAEKMLATDGQSVTFQQVLDKHKGKTVLIEIWASWCGDCVKAMPKLKETQKAHPGVDYVFISMDKADDKWKAGIEKHQLVGDHYWVTEGMKGAFGKAIDLDWIPRYIIVDKTGNVAVYRAIETDFETINNTLTQLK